MRSMRWFVGFGAALVAALAAGCGDESSRVDVGTTPYHVEVRVVDPATDEELPLTGDAATWPLGLPDGPSLKVTYWADRPTPALSLSVRAVGADVVAPTTTAEPDPWADDPYADPTADEPAAGESQAAIPLALIDEQHRSVRVDLLAPTRPVRAVVTVVLGGASVSTSIDFAFSDVTLSAPPTGVADGATEVDVTVTGVAGQVVDLETSLGTFVAPGFSSTASLTLQPTTEGSSEGQAEVGLLADAPGSAVVQVSGSRADWVRIDFAEVRLSFGTPVAQDFLPGKVVHEICVAANTDQGEVSLAGTALDAEVLDGGPVPLLKPDGALPGSCPAGTHAGYALFRWAASGLTDTVTASWNSPDDAVTASASARVPAETFAGYHGTLDATPLDFDDPYPILLEAHLSYTAVGGLGARPASGVGVTFVVLSPGGATQLIADTATGADGTATAVYEVAADDTLQVFLQPEGWSSILLGSAP